MRRHSPARRAGHLLEMLGLRAVLAVSRALDIDRASALGGRLLRALGPRLPLHRTAERNLRRILPDLDAPARRRVLDGMWDNLGRVVFEFPHLRRLDPLRPGSLPLPDGTPRVQVAGLEILERLRAAGGRAVFAGAHLANWEVSAAVLEHAGLPMTYVYRHAENPWSERIIQRHRSAGVEYVRKRHAGRALVEALRRGRSIGVLNDQRLTEGVLVDFLGAPAGTAPVATALALRAGLPVHPVRVERTGGAGFRVTVEEALPVPGPGGSRGERNLALLQALNDRFGAWIRARPADWLWIHRRWPEE